MKQLLTEKIERVMKSDISSESFFSFENFLFVCSKIYSIGIKARYLLYKFNIIKAEKLPCFVISIGNITVGGTGKTPMTMYVARLIMKLGYKPVIVTRGYQGEYKQAQAIVSDGSDFFLDVKDAGDEAYMMAENLKIPVIVGKKRYQAGMLAIEKFNPDVIILDDAFQHIALKRDLNLLLCDFNRPFGNFELMPRGQLREPENAAHRSDAVIFTRSDKKDESNQIKPHQAKKLDLLKEKPIFHASHSASVVNHVNCKLPSNIADSGITSFLFSAIADNSDFRSTCKNMGMTIKGFSEFLDHHWYTKEDLAGIYEAYKKSKADYLVTTGKDYVKIKELMPDQFPLIVIGVQIQFKDEHQDQFENLIKTSLNTYLKNKA